MNCWSFNPIKCNFNNLHFNVASHWRNLFSMKVLSTNHWKSLDYIMFRWMSIWSNVYQAFEVAFTFFRIIVNISFILLSVTVKSLLVV